MSRTGLEAVLRRLLTDYTFREAYRRHPLDALTRLTLRGITLTEIEIQSLISIGPARWVQLAEQTDPARHALPAASGPRTGSEGL
jgi:hypothetical protein